MKNIKKHISICEFLRHAKSDIAKLPLNSRNTGHFSSESNEKLPEKARDTEVKSARGKSFAPPPRSRNL